MVKSFDDIRYRFPDWDPAMLPEWRAVTAEDVQRIASCFEVEFPPSFIAFQTEESRRTPIGDRAWDGFGFATPDAPAQQNLATILKDARECGLKPFLVPFCRDEGTLWCFDTRSRRSDGECKVVLWDHNETQDPDGVIQGDHARHADFLSWLDATFADD